MVFIRDLIILNGNFPSPKIYYPFKIRHWRASNVLHITQQFSISFLFFACFCYSCSFHFEYLFIFFIHNWFFPPPSSLSSIFISSSSPERPCKNKTTTSRHETSLITFCFIIILFVSHRRNKNKVTYSDTNYV